MANVLISLGALAAEPVKVVVLEPGSGALETRLRREVAAAAELGKVPFVQITAEWCAPCKALRASLDDPLMRAAFTGTYIIQVDFDAWEQELKAAGFENPGIPVFFAVDALARPTGSKIDGARGAKTFRPTWRRRSSGSSRASSRGNAEEAPRLDGRSADRERPQRRARRALEADRRRDEQELVGAVGGELLERHVLDVEDAVLHHELLVHGDHGPVEFGDTSFVDVSPPVTVILRSTSQRATSSPMPGKLPALYCAGVLQSCAQP